MLSQWQAGRKPKGGEHRKPGAEHRSACTAPSSSPGRRQSSQSCRRQLSHSAARRSCRGRGRRRRRKPPTPHSQSRSRLGSVSAGRAAPGGIAPRAGGRRGGIAPRAGGRRCGSAPRAGGRRATGRRQWSGGYFRDASDLHFLTPVESKVTRSVTYTDRFEKPRKLQES